MKLIACLLVLLVISCELPSVARASARYEKGLVMGYLLGNYRNLNGRLGMIPIPLILAHIANQ